VSEDGGCTWNPDASIGSQFVRDVATDGEHRHVVALTSSAQDNGDYELRVWRSSTSAVAGAPPIFGALGPPISRDLIGFTVDVAPSDPDRIYVSGALWPLAASADAGALDTPDGSPQGPNGPAFLLRSRDGGATWERRRLRGASLYSSPYIAAVDPNDANVLYVRVQSPPRQKGFVSSHLLYSDDAGDSFREVFRAPADMLGFALSPDGTRVYLGLGDPREPDNRRPFDPGALGLYEATVPEFSFSRVFEGQIGCLTYSGETLFACGAHFSNGFEVGASTDRGRSFGPLLDFGGIAGPLACPASSRVSSACAAAWPVVCDPVGVCPTPSSNAGDPGVSSDPEPRPAPGDPGCCENASRTSARGMAPGAGAMALALGASLAFRRRRRP
jgi:hypothetical protein